MDTLVGTNHACNVLGGWQGYLGVCSEVNCVHGCVLFHTLAQVANIFVVEAHVIEYQCLYLGEVLKEVENGLEPLVAEVVAAKVKLLDGLREARAAWQFVE
eukprot:GDKK01066917.1.p2 GENE.GDKK01066917.1~~GDKK01066917.1.p2  ORF type:complete len:101 (-),score=6.25 GDKK01066917.1:250-552(-)